MPEGDTLHSLAGVLTPQLAGRPVRRMDILDRRRPLSLRDETITSVQALGKHLLIALQSDRSLQVHLGLYGSWHSYAPGEVWRKPRHQARLILELPERIHVCFNARSVELVRTRDGGPPTGLRRHLGPDLAVASVDLDSVLQRARTRYADPDLLLDLLLDQRVAAGIGNVYKSELLFLVRLPPQVRVGAVDDQALRALFANANRLLRANIGRRGRDTRDIGNGGTHLWVYRRAGQPCLLCATPIRLAHLGRDGRSTYRCPGCQG